MKRSREHGMITFDQALYEAFKRGEISEEDALLHADSANEVRLMIKLGERRPGGVDHDLDAAAFIDPTA